MIENDFSRGVCLTDLTFIEEGNKDFLKDLINFKKRELVCKIIEEVQLYQHPAHNFPTNPQLVFLLNNLPYDDEEKLYQLSLLREPRNTQSKNDLE